MTDPALLQMTARLDLSGVPVFRATAWRLWVAAKALVVTSAALMVVATGIRCRGGGK